MHGEGEEKETCLQQCGEGCKSRVERVAPLLAPLGRAFLYMCGLHPIQPLSVSVALRIAVWMVLYIIPLVFPFTITYRSEQTLSVHLLNLVSILYAVVVFQSTRTHAYAHVVGKLHTFGNPDIYYAVTGVAAFFGWIDGALAVAAIDLSHYSTVARVFLNILVFFVYSFVNMLGTAFTMSGIYVELCVFFHVRKKTMALESSLKERTLNLNLTSSNVVHYINAHGGLVALTRMVSSVWGHICFLQTLRGFFVALTNIVQAVKILKGLIDGDQGALFSHYFLAFTGVGRFFLLSVPPILISSQLQKSVDHLHELCSYNVSLDDGFATTEHGTARGKNSEEASVKGKEGEKVGKNPGKKAASDRSRMKDKTNKKEKKATGREGDRKGKRSSLPPRKRGKASALSDYSSLGSFLSSESESDFSTDERSQSSSTFIELFSESSVPVEDNKMSPSFIKALEKQLAASMSLLNYVAAARPRAFFTYFGVNISMKLAMQVFYGAGSAFFLAIELGFINIRLPSKSDL